MKRAVLVLLGATFAAAAAQSHDLPIPGEPYSFGVLEMAQALGDFQSLDRTGRRALFVQLPRRDVALFESVAAQLLNA